MRVKLYRPALPDGQWILHSEAGDTAFVRPPKDVIDGIDGQICEVEAVLDAMDEWTFPLGGSEFGAT